MWAVKKEEEKRGKENFPFAITHEWVSERERKILFTYTHKPQFSLIHARFSHKVRYTRSENSMGNCLCFSCDPSLVNLRALLIWTGNFVNFTHNQWCQFEDKKKSCKNREKYFLREKCWKFSQKVEKKFAIYLFSRVGRIDCT